jgi:hypothetical protein
MRKFTLKLKRNLIHSKSLVISRINFILTSLLICFTIFSGVEASGQDIKEMRNFLAAMKASDNAVSNSQATELESLVFNLHSSVIIQEGKVSTFSEAPFICVEVDAKSMAKLYEADLLFSHAELLTIRIDNPDDLKMSLDIANLKGFSGLKYINFLCSINCTAEQVSNLIKSSDSGIIVFYLVSIPS